MSSKRKPGAPPGNKNALKHGIFSRFITLADDQSMQAMSAEDRKDDLAMARVAFKLAWEKRLAASTTKEQLAWDFCAHYWLQTIDDLKVIAEEKAGTETEVWDSFMEAIRRANDRQGVKR